ncbi:hypothetical protein BGW80DRAFT_1263442 [Lactifluus volemus]|nr:hypothetical protein BGW80DRAFT_1263442 [Lactifluus volemus]
MFSQFRNANSPPPTRPSSRPLTERPLKAKLEDRLRATFTIGDESNPSTPTASSLCVRPSMSPTSIPLPISPPPNDHDHDHSLDTSLPPPHPLSTILPDGSDNSVSAEPDSTVDIGLELVNQHFLQNSPAADIPISPQVLDLRSAASEEGAEVNDAVPQTIISEAPRDSVDTVPAVETERHESDVGSIPVEESQSEHSSTNVEALQERLRVMEQRFVDVSASFARLQAEKLAADKVVQELTPAQGSQDAQGLRDYLQNSQIKAEVTLYTLVSQFI